MTNNWKKVFSTNEMLLVRLAKDILKAHKIDSVILNKQDSAYTVFGEQELHVPVTMASRAIAVLADNDIN